MPLGQGHTQPASSPCAAVPGFSRARSPAFRADLGRRVWGGIRAPPREPVSRAPHIPPRAGWGGPSERPPWALACCRWRRALQVPGGSGRRSLTWAPGTLARGCTWGLGALNCAAEVAGRPGAGWMRRGGGLPGSRVPLPRPHSPMSPFQGITEPNGGLGTPGLAAGVRVETVPSHPPGSAASGHCPAQLHGLPGAHIAR